MPRSTVKLVSREGFEFIVDYKAACVSNTIRNMLSSQGACARSTRVQPVNMHAWHARMEKAPWSALLSLCSDASCVTCSGRVCRHRLRTCAAVCSAQAPSRKRSSAR